jgi:Lens epithelium-derived growth factor (LEDGF)
MKKVKNYIGNYASWNLEEAQLADFREKASEIRKIADEIYNSFKV